MKYSDKLENWNTLSGLTQEVDISQKVENMNLQYIKMYNNFYVLVGIRDMEL